MVDISTHRVSVLMAMILVSILVLTMLFAASKASYTTLPMGTQPAPVHYEGQCPSLIWPC